MRKRQVYFRDSTTLECWQVVAGYWQKLDARDAFDDLPNSEVDYYAFDSIPQGWMGNAKINPMPYIGY